MAHPPRQPRVRPASPAQRSDARRLHEAAWPDMFANLQTAYAELTQTQFELQTRAAEIEDARDLFQHVIESMSEALFLLDRSGRVQRSNKAASDLLECPEAELLGQTLEQLCDTDELPATPWQLLAREPSGVLPSLDVIAYSRTGRAIPLSASCGLVRDKRSKIIGMLVVARDMTERKQAEEQIRRLNEDLQRRAAELTVSNKELESFSYSVSHDLRAPLRSINGFSQALLEDFGDQLDAEAMSYLQRVRAASERMGELIDDMLHLARVTRADLERETLDLSELARQVAAELAEREPTRPVEWVTAPGLVVQGDRRLLRIALENLLGNAWKFTSKQPQARIELGTVEQDGRLAYFVRDNGAGFDMAYADKLFGTFQRLHSPSEFEGTGIGLATVNRIIRRHGGQIWAEAAIGEGATFFFTL